MTDDTTSAVVKYVGGDNYITGVPKRDMTVEEWEALPEEKRQQAVKAEIYTLPKKESKK